MRALFAHWQPLPSGTPDALRTVGRGDGSKSALGEVARSPRALEVEEVVLGTTSRKLRTFLRSFRPGRCLFRRVIERIGIHGDARRDAPQEIKGGGIIVV